MYRRQVRHLRWFLITVSDGRRARHHFWRRFVRSSVRNWSLTGRARSSSNCGSGQSIEVKDKSEGRSYITYALNYLEDPACLNIWRRCYNSMNDVRTPSLASSTCRTREKKYRGIWRSTRRVVAQGSRGYTTPISNTRVRANDMFCFMCCFGFGHEEIESRPLSKATDRSSASRHLQRGPGEHSPDSRTCTSRNEAPHQAFESPESWNLNGRLGAVPQITKHCQSHGH